MLPDYRAMYVDLYIKIIYFTKNGFKDYSQYYVSYQGD